MSHEDKGWQAHYGSSGQGQQYRCIKCGNGGASSAAYKPLTYNCWAEGCKGIDTMWPTPQYALYRQLAVKLEAAVDLLTEFDERYNGFDPLHTKVKAFLEEKP